MPADEPPVAPPPPPPPAQGAGGHDDQYGAQPPSRSYNLGEALSYGWSKFQANLAQILVAALVLLAAFVVVGLVGSLLSGALLQEGKVEIDPETGGMEVTEGSGMVMSLLVGALVAALFLIASQVVAAGIVRGALGITEGRPFRVGELFRTDQLGPVVVLSLVNGAAVFVGTLLCYLPGLAYGFVSFFSLFFLVDKGLSPVDSIKASFELVREHLADTLVWYVVGGVIAAAGAVVCGVGLLVTVPLVLVATAYTYKTLTGQPVAP